MLIRIPFGAGRSVEFYLFSFDQCHQRGGKHHWRARSKLQISKFQALTVQFVYCSGPCGRGVDLNVCNS